MKKYKIKDREIDVYMISEVKDLLQDDKTQYNRLSRVYKKHNDKFEDKIIGFMEVENKTFVQVYESEVM